MPIIGTEATMISSDQYIMQLEVPVISILRGIGVDVFGQLMQTSFAAGLESIEVTMNTPDAEEIIARNRENVPSGKYLGLGTVRNLAEAERAYTAGAMFIVTPNVDLDVIGFARSKGIPVIAGGLTPTEVYKAWNAGASMVKVFPCRSLGGPQYIRELRGPFDQIPLVAVGGVNIRNVNEYLQAGANCVGVGLSLFGEQAVADKNWDAVAKNVNRFIAGCTKL
jgi:2-dehydro-3-deoxyphosphogluconate aldolase/(4S)-4-hydroxy-2-oxoglutarate aldolase